MVASIKKDPLLHWGALFPRRQRSDYFASFDKRKTAYLFLCRHAIYQALSVLGVKPGETILVPAYHCSALIDPILSFGATVRFYDVKRDCSPNLEDIATKIDHSTKALLCIHYFGFPQAVTTLRQVCDSAGIYLIEDCAHVFGTMVDAKPLGSSGDISMFSVRKFLPIQDGGILVVNNPRLQLRVSKQGFCLLPELKAIKDFLDRLADETSATWFELLSRLWRVPARIVGQMGARGVVKVSGSLTINGSGAEFDRRLVGLPMMKVSQYLLWNSDFVSIKKKRRDNYRRLLDAMQHVSGLECVYPVLPDGVSPMVFPVIVKDRANFHLVLRERGVPAVTWGGVIHGDLPKDLYPDAWFLYDRLVMLPVHQDIGNPEIEFMLEVVRTASNDKIPKEMPVYESSLR